MNSGQKVIKIGAIALAVFIIICIVNALLFALTPLVYNGKTKNVDEVYQNIANLDIDTDASKITIIKGAEFRITGKDVSDNLKIKQRGESLTVKENRGWFWRNDTVGEITITIPDGILNKLDIDTGAGSVDITDLNVTDFDIDQGAGTITIDNSVFRRTGIDGGAGKIDITASTLHNLDLDAGVGKIDIEGYVTGNSEIDCGVGEVNLSILGLKEDYSLHVQKGVGSINIDGTSYSDDARFGTGTNIIRVDGGVGSININFKEA